MGHRKKHARSASSSSSHDMYHVCNIGHHSLYPLLLKVLVIVQVLPKERNITD